MGISLAGVSLILKRVHPIKNMEYFRIRAWSACALLLFCGSLTAFCEPLFQQFEAGGSTTLSQTPSMPVEQIARRLEEKNAQRAAALNQFSSTRIYHMQYRGFPSDREAEMVVNVTYQAPNSKQFHVVSQTGSKFVIDRVFKKLLEGEQEAANDENRKHTALNRENYDFTFAGYENGPDGPEYVLNLLPKTRNKFLYRGKIWVDAKDFAVVRIEGEPARNPSFWIKKTEVKHRYAKVSDFWLPAENHTESVIRLGGQANLWIEYKDYKITKAAPLYGLGTPREDSK